MSDYATITIEKHALNSVKESIAMRFLCREDRINS
jgi:hypothetical protein